MSDPAGILSEIKKGQVSKERVLAIANLVGEKISQLEKLHNPAIKEWQKVVVRLRANPWFSGIYCREILMTRSYKQSFDDHLAYLVREDKYGIFTDILLSPYHDSGELEDYSKARVALYESLEAAVTRGDAFAIKNLVKAFKKFYPNPQAELQDPETTLRAISQRNNAGFSVIEMPGAKYNSLLLGSRPLIKPLSKDDETALKKLTVMDDLSATLEKINNILETKGYQGSPFFVTLWDIIFQGLKKKVIDTAGQLERLVITIQSMQEVSELFDEKGNVKKIAGLNFITSQREIDDFVAQITPYLCDLGILKKTTNPEAKPLEIILQRIPLYDHDILDARTGKAVNFEQYRKKIDAIAEAHERSDVLYMHCYSGKERSVNTTAHLLMQEMSENWTFIEKQQLGEARKPELEFHELFLTPVEVYSYIKKQRKIAQTLEEMSISQQQITFAHFFTFMNALRFSVDSEMGKDKSEEARVALAKAFAAKGAEIIACNLFFCLRGFKAYKRGESAELIKEENDCNEVMFRVLRNPQVSIVEIEKYYAKYVPRLHRTISKLGFVMLAAVIAFPLLLLTYVLTPPLGRIAYGWIKKQFTKQPNEAMQTADTFNVFRKSFVPEMFLKFLQDKTGLEILLDKKPAEIAKYVACFLSSPKATLEICASYEMKRFVGQLVRHKKATEVYKYLSFWEKRKLSGLLEASVRDAKNVGNKAFAPLPIVEDTEPTLKSVRPSETTGFFHENKGDKNPHLDNQ